MPLPFGLKAPSRGTLIFSGLAGTLSGLIYTSNKHAEESRQRLVQQVSFLANKPCGVHEMPRKVLVYISAPPGDTLEKSRNWFREYIKPVLVAGAVDYEVKESRTPGQIETSVIEEIVKERRKAEVKQEEPKQLDVMQNPLLNQQQQQITKPIPKREEKYDGILAVGRNAYREVLSGLAKGCEASLIEPVEEKPTEKIENKTDNETEGSSVEVTESVEIKSESIENQPSESLMISQHDTEEKAEEVDHFSLPPKFSPVIYIPHVNIIGWSNIPYRLYMWYADYKRIDEVGKYVATAVLNETRPIEERDANMGLQEMKYWFGDDEADSLKNNDTPIVIDERIFDKLTTYTSENLP